MTSARRIRDYFWRYRGAFIAGVAFLILTQAIALAIPQLLRISTDGILGHDRRTVELSALGLIGAAVAGATVRILSRLFIFNGGRRVEYDMRNDLFRHLERLEPSFYDTMPLAQVMSRMVNDLTQVRLLLGPGILNITNTSVAYLVVVPLLFISDAELAFYSLLPLPLLLLLGRAFARRLYEHSMEAQERLGVLSTKVQENLSGVMTVRAYRREPEEKRSFGALNDRYIEVNMKLARVRGVMLPMMGIAGAAGTVIALLLGGRRIAAGRMTVGEFVEFTAYLAALTWPTIALGWMISIWQRGLASMARINEILEATPKIVDGIGSPLPVDHTLEIRDLVFSYGEGRHPALDRISTTIRSGETVVVVGRTGSGKSTLLKAIARLIEVPRNAIHLGGVDVTELSLGDVRGSIAYAPQDAFLFSRTLFENIAFGAPGASEAAVNAASEAAGLAPDVSTFPEGIETVVGERGITLSGGQRQRAALARALLTDPKILLLDDSLAAVDTETESRILSALAKRGPGRTTILVTHRLASASSADRILVLDRGRIVEQGTEEELLALEGIYKEMHRRQRLRRAIEEKSQRPPEDGLVRDPGVSRTPSGGAS